MLYPYWITLDSQVYEAHNNGGWWRPFSFRNIFLYSAYKKRVGQNEQKKWIAVLKLRRFVCPKTEKVADIWLTHDFL